MKDGASKGVELGDAIDKFWSTVRALEGTTPEPAKSVAWYDHFELIMYSGLMQLEKTFGAYLVNVDVKKIAPKPPKTAEQFKKKFHEEFVGAVNEHRVGLGIKRTEMTKFASALATFATQLANLDHMIAAHGEPKAHTVGKAELEKFASGPVRAILEYNNEASHRNGWPWVAGVRDQLDDIPKAIDRMPDSPSPNELRSFIDMAKARSASAGELWVRALTNPH
ncbi:MAG: hypothetical protein IPO29_13655 [Anaerolineae bacterium]|nr:hypothetical protein [Anaerolineae bacterium]